MHTQLGPVGALFLALSLAAIVSCAPGQSGHQDERATRRDCEASSLPAGDATMFTLGGQTLEGVQVGQVQTCGDERVGFIRLTPDSGSRILTLGRNEQGGVDDCTPDAVNPKTCPRVQAGSFARRVEEALHERKIRTIGFGVGICGDIDGDYHDWNISISIHDWKEADEAVKVLAAKLIEWDVQNSVGISVDRIRCGVAY